MRQRRKREEESRKRRERERGRKMQEDGGSDRAPRESVSGGRVRCKCCIVYQGGTMGGRLPSYSRHANWVPGGQLGLEGA